jgi:hypothetical protein
MNIRLHLREKLKDKRYIQYLTPLMDRFGYQIRREYERNPQIKWMQEARQKNTNAFAEILKKYKFKAVNPWHKEKLSRIYLGRQGYLTVDHEGTVDTTDVAFSLYPNQKRRLSQALREWQKKLAEVIGYHDVPLFELIDKYVEESEDSTEKASEWFDKWHQIFVEKIADIETTSLMIDAPTTGNLSATLEELRYLAIHAQKQRDEIIASSR